MNRQITQAMVEYLVGIFHNNNREWFLANKALYNQAKTDFEQIIQACIYFIRTVDTTIPQLTAVSCMYRPNRDIRFTNNKRLYKEHFSAFVSPNGKNWDGAGYYIHIEPMAESFFAAGHYYYRPALVANLREQLVQNPKKFVNILSTIDATQHFTPLSGTALQRMPRGFTANTPLANLVKLQSYVYQHNYTKAELKSDDFVACTNTLSSIVVPFNQYINTLRTK
jgi:uncharacterized protein (TIGR02453 family)